MNKGRLRLAAILAVLAVSCGPILADPVITQQPTNALNQSVGGNVQLCVVAESTTGTNALTYQWLKNGVIIPPDGNTFVGVNNSCLAIIDIQAVDSGGFSVLIGDGVGVVLSRVAEVTVAGAGITTVGGSSSVGNAMPLPEETQFIIRSSNSGFTKQAGTPNIIANDPGGSEIWFQWTCPSTPAAGAMTFSTLGSDFDTTLGVYTMSPVAVGLIPVPSAINDDDGAGYLNSTLSFNAVTGTTYFVAVDGFYGAQGNVVLSGTFTPAAGTIPSNVGTPFDIVASNKANVVLTSPWPGNKCNWLFNQQPVATNQASLTIPGLNPNNTGAYMASFITSGGLTVNSEPILVQINLLQDGSTATNSVVWNKFLNSVNDSFTQGGALGPIKLGDTSGYTDSQTCNISHGCVSEPHQPLLCNADACCANWYSYTAPADGTLEISTVSPATQFATIVGVFLASPLNSFGFPSTMVGCGSWQNSTQPSVYMSPVPMGQNFCVMVQPESTVANGCASGSYTLSLYFASCNLDIVRTGSTVTVSWPLACGTNLQASPTPKGPWTGVTAPITKSTSGYSCSMAISPANVFFTLQ